MPALAGPADAIPGYMILTFPDPGSSDTKRTTMKKYIKASLIKAIRSFGYDLSKIQKVPYAIFLDPHPTIANVSHQGCDLKFFIGNPTDHIQETHLQGALYEPEELSIIQKHYTPGTTFVDIGSNVGNHAIWAAKVLGAPRVIAFEPVLGQHTLLCANVAVNALSDAIDVHKIALSSSVGTTYIARSFVVTKSSGGARVSSMALGERVAMSTGDLQLVDTGPIFIKIDVEGHEMDVLAGLHNTIKRLRPKLFIEVDADNETRFDRWLQQNGYEKADTFKRHKANCNYLIAPSS